MYHEAEARARAQDEERGRSNFDVSHRLSLSYSYMLPFKKPGDGLVASLVNGWETFGIVTLQTGRPFTVALLSEIDNSGTGRSILGFGANDRPNLIGDPELSNSTTLQWFNTAAFVANDRYTLGNAQRNLLRGPGVFNLDLALRKSFNFSQRLRGEVRVESFNATNTPPLGNPNTQVGNPNFGRILSAGPGRSNQLSVKVLF